MKNLIERAGAYAEIADTELLVIAQEQFYVIAVIVKREREVPCLQTFGFQKKKFLYSKEICLVTN